MSRDLTINKIAPHITSASTPGINPASEVPAFSPYGSKFHEQNAAEQDEKNRTTPDQTEAVSSVKTDSDGTKKEIFKLIALPDFSGLFALAEGKENDKLMYIIKDIRSQRGVTKSMPVSNNHIPSTKDFSTYLKTNAQFFSPTGEQFTGVM